jgi:hypothetical protein
MDDETFIVAGALDVIALMCTCAGSFMTSRITSFWRDFLNVSTRCGVVLKNKRGKGRVVPRAQPSPALDLSKESLVHLSSSRANGFSTMDKRQNQAIAGVLWESFVGATKAIALNVRISDELFDDLLEMMEPVLRARPDVKEALETRNPDAVWLCIWKLNQVGC